jgi:hypothetical protein
LLDDKDCGTRARENTSRLWFYLPEIDFCAMDEKPIVPKRQFSIIGVLSLLLWFEQEIIVNLVFDLDRILRYIHRLGGLKRIGLCNPVNG